MQVKRLQGNVGRKRNKIIDQDGEIQGTSLEGLSGLDGVLCRLRCDLMNRVDRFIASCPSWEDFWQRTRQLSDAEKGRAFERLVQLYLQTEPEYRTKLRHVWTLREVPPDVCKRLDLPSRDEGIDLIACTNHGEYWAIQSKFRSQRYKPLNRRELGTFSSLAFNTAAASLWLLLHIPARSRSASAT